MDELKNAILAYVKKEFIDEDEDDIELTETTSLISGGIVDSFSMVSLKTFLEKKYSIKLPDEEATPEAFDSVVKIADLVKKHQS